MRASTSGPSEPLHALGVDDATGPAAWLLGRGTIGETWAVPGAGGSRIAEKAVSCPDPAARSQLLRRIGILRELPSDLLLPVLGAVVDGERVMVRTELLEGLSLKRLLRVATLTPSQAAAVGHAVLGGLIALHRARLCHGAMHAGNVHVAPDGRVRLGDGGLVPLVRRRGSARDARCMRADAAAAVAIIAGSLPAERPGRGSTAAAARLVAELEAAVAALDGRGASPAAGVRGPAEVVMDALISGSGELVSEQRRAAARAQLGALVRSVRRPEQGREVAVAGARPRGSGPRPGAPAMRDGGGPVPARERAERSAMPCPLGGTVRVLAAVLGAIAVIVLVLLALGLAWAHHRTATIVADGWGVAKW